MTDLRRPIVLLATLAILLVACGSGGTGGSTAAAPTQDTANSGSAAATAAAPATTATTPATDAPTEAPGPTEQPGTGGTAGGVCDLVTPDELAEIFGVASVATTVFAGPPDTCSADSDTGDPLVAWSYSNAQAQAVYDAFVSDPSSVEVGGIGDKAAFVQNTGLLVLKDGALVVIGVASGDEEIAKRIGAAAAGRM